MANLVYTYQNQAHLKQADMLKAQVIQAMKMKHQ
jgi:hypothetical protein